MVVQLNLRLYGNFNTVKNPTFMENFNSVKQLTNVNEK
jgi:hypothetical protein